MLEEARRKGVQFPITGPVMLTAPVTHQYQSAGGLLVSFALELYLKGISSARSGGEFVSGHNLYELFEALPAADQIAIRQVYDNPPHLIHFMRERDAKEGIPTQFDDALKASAQAFTGIRYAFDKNSKYEPNWVAGNILTATRIFAFGAFPDYFQDCELHFN